MRYFVGRKPLALAGECVPANTEIQMELWGKLSVRVQKSLLNSGFVLLVLDNPTPVVKAGKVVLAGVTISAGEPVKLSVWQSLSKKLQHALKYTGRVVMCESETPPTPPPTQTTQTVEPPKLNTPSAPRVTFSKRNKHRGKS